MTTNPSSKESLSKEPKFFSFENFRSLGILILIILALRWSVASPYHVPTASMEPTIKVGDRLLAFKLAYDFKLPFTDWVIFSWGTPKRGDIIVFKYPRDPDIDYVKRIVAVAGDEILLKDDILYINGAPQPMEAFESDRSILEDIYDNKDQKSLFKETLTGVNHWVIQDQSIRHYKSKTWPPDGVPKKISENSVFVIGDNRDNSTDSRFWGEVPLSYVRGKATFVIWSLYQPKQDAAASESFWSTFRYVFRYNRIGYWLR